MLVRAATLALVLTTASAAQTPADSVRQLVADRTGDVPGAVVGVVQNGELIFAEPFGLANLTYGIPYTLDTPTNIGSTSKQFTAFAIGLLAERGALSLDDDVRDYVPELPDLGATVRIRHLLTHTSGYREFLNTLAVAGWRLDQGDAITRDDILRVVERQPELQNAPGAEWNYNNTGFALLALIVERVTGETFPAWMRANVFEPFGMTHTVVRSSSTAIVEDRAVGYVRDGEDWREAIDFGTSMGAGAIYSTVGDLARWMSNLQSRAVGADIIERMTTPTRLTTGERTGYGQGLFIDESGGQRRIHHGGADAAHRSAFILYPDLDAGVIVLTNSADNVEALAERAARVFFPDAFEAQAGPPAPVASATFEPTTFDAYAGRYSLDEAPLFVFALRRDGDRYLILPTGQPETEIVPTSDSTFASTIVDARLTFHRDADGVVRSLTLHQGGDHPATRLDLDGAEAFDLTPYAGRFTSDELEATYTLAVEDGALVARDARGDAVTLTHAEGDVFSLPIGTVSFERDASGAVVGYVVDATRSRGMRFERVE